LSESTKKRILVAPLDWGLGHSARCVPIIHRLLKQNHDVCIAAQGNAASMLSAEFPRIPILPIPGYAIRYTAIPIFMYLKFFWFLAKVFITAFREHLWVQKIVTSHSIDIIISDNRFGLFTSKARTVYISHQLMVKMPRHFTALEKVFWRGHSWAIGKFNTLWIPDLNPPDDITGSLSHKYPLPAHARHVGILSRFSLGRTAPSSLGSASCLVIVSGPEPQRQQFETEVVGQLTRLPGKSIVLRGKPGKTPNVEEVADHVFLVSHVESKEFAWLIQQAEIIVARGGYTTIMDLWALEKKALLVPTPGQTEQLYLCERLAAQKRFIVQRQKDLNLESGFAALRRLPPVAVFRGQEELLNSAIDDILNI